MLAGAAAGLVFMAAAAACWYHFAFLLSIVPSTTTKQDIVPLEDVKVEGAQRAASTVRCWPWFPQFWGRKRFALI